MKITRIVGAEPKWIEIEYKWFDCSPFNQEIDCGE